MEACINCVNNAVYMCIYCDLQFCNKHQLTHENLSIHIPRHAYHAFPSNYFTPISSQKNQKIPEIFNPHTPSLSHNLNLIFNLKSEVLDYSNIQDFRNTAVPESSKSLKNLSKLRS